MEITASSFSAYVHITAKKSVYNKKQNSMISAWAWTLLILAGSFQGVLGSSLYEEVAAESNQVTPDSEPPENYPINRPLHLTPYIEMCLYDLAKNLSKVTFFQNFTTAPAYSGYITVDKDTDSNLFFVLIEAETNSDNAPLLLWTQGGPGLSALFGLFLENGPANFHSPLNITKRTNTLQKHMSVLYVDVPVGAGFSYTRNGYPQKLEDVVKHEMEFLKQFLELFREYKGRKLYLAGESYGARYSVALADHILRNPAEIDVCLAGVIGGNGFLGPILETADSSEFLYEVSMLTEEGRANFSAQFQLMKQLLPRARNDTDVAKYLLYLLFSTIFTNSPPTLFQNLTMYNDHASPLHTQRPARLLTCYGFISMSEEFKIAIHAGENASFQYNNEDLLTTFASDWLRDIRNMTQHVLEKIRVLFYLGQIDALFPSVQQRAHYAKLNWTRSAEYKQCPRTTWKPEPWKRNLYSGFAAYVKKVTNFTEAVVLGMSHYGAVEKPDEVYYLVTEFVNKSELEPKQC
ncbi:putative serine carboxypeptidase CPVL [Rhipicephalus microplus]|uniref:putative serine carboxypeptidase CPVL n=1 Tax=Rhipicephalus microplus TaxID=6941 RepID=UPI003F6B0235